MQIEMEQPLSAGTYSRRKASALPRRKIQGRQLHAFLLAFFWTLLTAFFLWGMAEVYRNSASAFQKEVALIQVEPRTFHSAEVSVLGVKAPLHNPIFPSEVPIAYAFLPQAVGFYFPLFEELFPFDEQAEKSGPASLADQ